MSIPSPRSLLAGAALGLLGEGATPDELRERFAHAGAGLSQGLEDELLAELRRMGLARVARVDEAGLHHVATTLGTRAIDDAVGGLPSAGLADLETLRTDLLSTIAHELRTPLTVIRTSVGLLADATSAPTEAQREQLLASMERNAERMQRLVGDILDLARYRAGGITLQLRRFDARDLAASVVASARPLAAARDQPLHLDAGEPAPSVYGDRRRLEQALVNLVSNAQRYSPSGSEIRLEVREDASLVRWRVVDRGPGIPDEDQERLFERFFVGRNDRHTAGEGVGLGLPTALAIAQAHGGTIEVVSRIGEGSAFTLVVPSDGPPGTE